MKRIFLIISIIFISKTIFCLSAQDIVKYVDANLTFVEGEMSATIIDFKNNKENKRMSVDIKFKRGRGTLMEFTSPAREKNKKILMINDNMWMFVPGISRPIRMSAKDSFMGTSFSNRDLMDFDIHNDYSAIILEQQENEYKLELISSNKNVTYPKIIMWVDKKSLLPKKQELYTISDNLIKTIDFSETKYFNGKLRPSVMVIKDILTQGNMTKVLINTMTEKQIKEELFSPQNIER